MNILLGIAAILIAISIYGFKHNAGNVIYILPILALLALATAFGAKKYIQ